MSLDNDRRPNPVSLVDTSPVHMQQEQGQVPVSVPAAAATTTTAPLGNPVTPNTPAVVVTDDDGDSAPPSNMGQKGRPRVASMPAAVLQENGVSGTLAPGLNDSALASVSTESLSAADDISPKRQDEFERFFGKRLTEDWNTNHPSYAQAQSRARAYSSVSLASTPSTASSVTTAAASDDTEVSPVALSTPSSSIAIVPPPPADYLMVLATQSCDLQASLLLHGRLYLTRYHLCFRSNILGVKTEKIHPLKDMVSVQKGTTAKWIQNAIYVLMAGDESEVDDGDSGNGSGDGPVTEDDASTLAATDDTSVSSATTAPVIIDEKDDAKKSSKRGRDRSKSTSSKSSKRRSESRGRKHEADGSKLYGYGSLADRDAMFSDVLQCWRVQAPDKHQAWMEREGRNADGSFLEGHGRKSKGRKRSGTTQTDGDSSSLIDGDEDEDDEQSLADEEGTSTPVAGDGQPKAPPVKHTTCPGENLKELAIDATIALPLDETYKMLYHNRDFILNFYGKDKGIEDPKISEWSPNEEGKMQRNLDFVISINNPIGPSSSDCNGTETIEIEQEGEAYAIRSETRTPGVPTGKNFKVVTRTCLTQTDIRGRPATRVYCSTQVDWSSSSLLKSTVTPAVIKGQKEHYRDLVDSARRWIRSHPDQFTQPPPPAPTTPTDGHPVVKRKDQAGRSVSFRDGGNSDEIEQSGEMKIRPPLTSRSSSYEDKSLIDYAMEIPSNPVMLAITALCAFLLMRDMLRMIF